MCGGAAEFGTIQYTPESSTLPYSQLSGTTESFTAGIRTEGSTYYLAGTTGIRSLKSKERIKEGRKEGSKERRLYTTAAEAIPGV